MTEYEQDFLLCSAAGFDATDLFFTSGPDFIYEPYTSVMVDSIVEYQSADVAVTISRLPNTELIRAAKDEHVWRWQQEDRYIEISVDEDSTTENGVWLASRLKVNCTFSDLVVVWARLAETHPAIYVHAPSCRMYTRTSFLEEVALGALWRAFRSDDPAVRAHATQDFHHYRLLTRQPRQWQRYWLDKVPHMAATLFDLPPPVLALKCKDFWHVNDWTSLMDQFDKMASVKKLGYFAYPTGEWVKQKYKSGFVVWVSEEHERLGKEIADSLGVLA
jgi:hypothetical protein